MYSKRAVLSPDDLDALGALQHVRLAAVAGEKDDLAGLGQVQEDVQGVLAAPSKLARASSRTIGQGSSPPSSSSHMARRRER